MRNRRNKRKPTKRRKAIEITSYLVIILGIVFVSTIFSLINSTNGKIINGVKIEDIDISGMTQEEASEKIKNWYNDVALQPITLKYEDIEQDIRIEEFDAEHNIDKVITEAMKVGRDGNILKDNYTIIFTSLFKKNLNIEITYNDEKINKIIEEISGKLPDTIIESSYYIEDNELIIKKGKDGIVAEKEQLKEQIKKTVKISDNKIIQIPVKEVKADNIDIGKIHEEIYKEAKNARIEENPTKVYAEVNGVDFAISMEEAKQILDDEKEEYIIPLNITKPEITLIELGQQAFPDLLSEFTTRYDASNKNRSINLTLASEKIDGTIIQPGEIFSYNKTVGARTIAAGYKEAAVYAGGKVVQGIGGGICQLSSTLYNTAIYANLDIVRRANHLFLTSYVQPGHDATVSWGTLDLAFKNTRTYPIKIVSTVKNGLVRVQMYGIKEDVEYEVELETNILDEMQLQIKYIYDDTMDEGTQMIEQYGSNGIKSETYKVLSLKGAVVSKELISTDTYSSLEKIVRIGTKKLEEDDENDTNKKSKVILDGDIMNNE